MNATLMHDSFRPIPALAAAALLAGCATPAPEAPAPVDFRQTIQTAEKAVFPALVYIRVVRKDLSSGKDEAPARTRRASSPAAAS